ncbi:MAG: RimK/LysX family protein [Candidatus Saccharimonadales bacterium]
MDTNMKELVIIGRNENADIPGDGIKNVPVKVDTGADISSIWASELNIDDDHVLSFVLFAKGSEYHTGKRHRTRNYSVNLIRSSNGARQVRYRVFLTIEIAGRRVKGSFTLADRSHNSFPVLIGCRLLKGKFLVDVSKGIYKTEKTMKFHEEFKKDPKAFFEKYHAANQRGDIEL